MKSLLCMPIKNFNDEAIAVVQFVNKKKNESKTVSFDDNDIKVLVFKHHMLVFSSCFFLSFLFKAHKLLSSILFNFNNQFSTIRLVHVRVRT